MELETKLAALARIYELYETYSRSLAVACRKHCAHCCTCNVSITPLEARHITRALSARHLAALHRAMRPQLDAPRYQPQITINQMAQLYRNRKEPPEETIDPDWGPCPLLENKACPIYKLRPFGCRCLLSTRVCGIEGYAQIDAYTITVNYVFSQFIEHLDQDGMSGNFSDVLLSLAPGDGHAQAPIKPGDHRCRLIANHPVPLLLIPPEHQAAAAPLVDQLHAIVSAS